MTEESRINKARRMAEKKAKLAIALKANIKRRKDQAKEAETGQSPPETSGEE